MTSAPEDAERLADYVEDGIAFRRRLRGWQRDTEFIREGGRIIYSVDADVIKLFLDPSDGGDRRGEGKSARRHYTEIFRHNHHYAATALAEAACEVIFFRATGRSLGVVVLPPHQEEVENILYGLLNDVHKNARHTREQLELNPEIEKALASEDVSLEDKYDLLRKHLPKLAEHHLEARGPHIEIKRLKELLGSSHLLQLRQFVVRHTTSYPEFSKLEVGNQVQDIIESSRARMAVSDHLVRTKATHNRLRDLRAIGQLLTMNTRMAEHGVRVVHVTGDPSLFRATEGFIVETGDPQEPQGSFADFYLRHPASFLAAPGVAYPALLDREAEDDDVSGMIRWVNVMLDDFDVEANPPRREIVERAAGALDRDSAALSRLENAWDEYVEPMVFEKVAAAEKRLADIDHQYFQDVRSLNEEALRTTARGWIEAVMATGYNFTEAHRARTYGPPRDVPLVWFDCESEADKALEAIQEALNSRAHSQSSDLLRYEASLRELRNLDEDGYFYDVGFAALFASANRWATTSVLADMAIDAAEKVVEASNGNDRVSGREAFYVASIARRNTAASPEDFLLAEQMLLRAKDALRQDNDFRKEKGIDQGRPISLLRFESEELALDLSRYLFSRFVLKSAEMATLSGSEYFASVESLLQRLPEEQEERIRNAVRRRLLVNLLSRFLHDPVWRDAVANSADERAAMLDKLNALRATLEKASSNGKVTPKPRSYLHEAVYTTAERVLDPPVKAQRRPFMQRAARLFAPSEIQKNVVTRYDQRRFEELRRLCDLI